MKKSAPFLVALILLFPALSSAQVIASEEAYRKAESRFHVYMETEITSAQPRELMKQLKKKMKLLLSGSSFRASGYAATQVAHTERNVPRRARTTELRNPRTMSGFPRTIL